MTEQSDEPTSRERLGDSARIRKRNVVYALDGCVWHITESSSGRTRRMVGYCMLMFDSSKAEKTRPPESQICDDCLEKEMFMSQDLLRDGSLENDDDDTQANR